MKTKFQIIALATILCATIWSCEKVTKTDDGWVDLGLPSGLLWASCNVGADNPQDYGYYFAWGETKPKKNFREDNYNCSELYDGSNSWVTKLVPTDDAATVNIGSEARMPTIEELRELIGYCDIESMTYKRVHGIKITGINGNSIFLPVAGIYDGFDSYNNDDGTFLKYEGTSGYYWSSSYTDKNYAKAIFFERSSTIKDGDILRYHGLTIRPVKQANQD